MQRRVVARRSTEGCGAHLLEVAHHRRPLPVDQHRHQQDQREALAAPEAEGENRAEQQRSHPGGVPAHRGLDQEGRRQGRAVGGDAVAQETLLRRAARRRRRSPPGWPARSSRSRRARCRPRGRPRRSARATPTRDHGELETPAAALGDRVGDHPAGQEQRRRPGSPGESRRRTGSPASGVPAEPRAPRRAPPPRRGRR